MPDPTKYNEGSLDAFMKKTQKSHKNEIKPSSPVIKGKFQKKNNDDRDEMTEEERKETLAMAMKFQYHTDSEDEDEDEDEDGEKMSSTDSPNCPPSIDEDNSAW